MSILRLIFVLILVTTFFGCGNDRADDRRSAPADSRPASMTVILPEYLPQMRDVVREFEQRYATRLDVQVKPTRELIAAAARGEVPAAEVVIVPTIEDAVRLHGFEVLQPFFVDAFMEGNVADRYLDDQGYYAGLTRYAMATVYLPNAVTDEEAGSYRNLIEANLRGIRVGAAHPDSSGLVGVIAGLEATLGRPAARLWASSMYTGTAGGLHGNDAYQLDRMLAGELDMAFISSGAALRWMLNGNPNHYAAADVWRVKLPRATATGDNYYNMRCIVMPKNAPNRNMAVAFINYLYEPAVQTQLTDAYFEWPCHTFSQGNDYLYAFTKGIGTSVSAETIEGALPVGWELVNSLAE